MNLTRNQQALILGLFLIAVLWAMYAGFLPHYGLEFN